MTEKSPFPPWPPEWPEIAESVAAAVRRGDWGRYHGESTAELVEKLRRLAAVTHCRPVSSGSLGVELALRGVGVSAGDHVALCGYDYPGNFRAIELIGARPVLLDADRASYSLDPAQLDTVPDSELNAVVVSHLYGVAAQMPQIREICDRKGWPLVEDACQAPGMEVGGQPAGSWGDIGVFSFGGSKPLTAGNGGALLTSDDVIASRLASRIERPSDSTPMSELQAAALLPQLDRLDECNRLRWSAAREVIDQTEWIRRAMAGREPCETSTFYKLAFLDGERDVLLGTLASRGLPVGVGYRSMHRSSDRRCRKIGGLEQCRVLGEQVCLLDHSALLSVGRQREILIEALSL